MRPVLHRAPARADLAALAKIAKSEGWKDTFCIVDVAYIANVSAIKKYKGGDAKESEHQEHQGEWFQSFEIDAHPNAKFLNKFVLIIFRILAVFI